MQSSQSQSEDLMPKCLQGPPEEETEAFRFFQITKRQSAAFDLKCSAFPSSSVATHPPQSPVIPDTTLRVCSQFLQFSNSLERAKGGQELKPNLQLQPTLAVVLSLQYCKAMALIQQLVHLSIQAQHQQQLVRYCQWLYAILAVFKDQLTNEQIGSVNGLVRKRGEKAVQVVKCIMVKVFKQHQFL